MPKSRRRPGREGPRRVAPPPARGEQPIKDGDTPLEMVPGRQPGRGMDRRSRGLVIGLMLVMFFLFVSIAWLAPDTSQADGRPSGETVLARMVLLLSLLGVTYGLLVWDRIIKAFRRIFPKSGP
jgi:hypothetical protein